MTSTAVSDYSSDSVRYYRHYFQDRNTDAPITDTEEDPERDSDKKKSGEKLPRIILRNKLGKELDTFTTLQEAIYRAKRNVKESLQATQPEEWRLPHAPLPSRPDYSRAVPSISELRKRRKAKQQKTSKSSPSLPYDIDVDDVGFVAESLQHLPKVPSLSFLRQDLLAEPKRYFPFVQSMLLFKKYLSETEKRDHVYHFPGFCTGCQRMGLCYGCERSLEPHYHMDQPVKTGGGFTFYKRDRPENELKHRNPSNWRYTFPELARRAGHFEAWKEREGHVPDQALNYDEIRKNVFFPDLETDENTSKKLTEEQGVEGETTLAGRQDKDIMSEEDEGILVDKITPEEEELLGIKHSKPSSQSTKRSKPSSRSTKRSKMSSPSTKISGLEGDDEMYSAETGSEVTGERIESEARGDTAHTSKSKRVFIVEDLKHLDGKSSGTGEGTYTDQSTDEDEDDDERMEGSQSRSSRRKLRSTRSRGTHTDEEDDDRSRDRSHSPSKSPFSRTSSEKRRLYKAPAPFKIKKRSRKIVASVSPFSSNRKYNLPKGDGFKVKKSDKSPTQIKEFKHHEGDWKAPKQFEVKRSDKKSTEFWSPPPPKEKPKPVKVKREIPKKVAHPPSPDSGLESEKMTDPRRVGQGRQTKNVTSPVSSINKDVLNSNESQTTDQSDSRGLESNSDMASCYQSDDQIQKHSSESINTRNETGNIEQTTPEKEPQKENSVGPVRNLNLNSNTQESAQEYVHVHENKPTDVQEKPPPVTMETDQQRETTPVAKTKPSSPEPPQNIISTPAKTPAPVIEKLKKEKPKKTKKEKVKDEPKPAPPTPPPPVVERSMSPDTPLPQFPSDGDTEVALATPTPEPTKEVPDLPVFDIPSLPEIKDEKKTKVDDRRTQLIQSVPKMKEVKEALPKKKFMPKINKRSMPKRRRSSAKAPVTPEELKQMTDPLDFLAKYCIINKDRLPYYDRIYQNIVSNQTPKYERIHDSHASIGASSSFPVLRDHEMNMLHDMTVINRAQEPVRIGLSVPEQYLEKICYTLDFLEQKQNKMSLDLHNLETEKIKKLAEKAKELIPHIIRPDFQVKPSKKASKKKKKKKGKGKEEKADSDEEAPPEKLTAADITDRVIVDRIDEKTLNSLCKQPDIHQIDLEMDRIAQKVSDIDERIEQLENEKNLLGIYCMEYFFRDQGRNKKPAEFRRQQSSLYNKLHPDPDIEMNMEELEGALQVINHSLLTEKEFEYLYNVLNLPGRLKINFQLFAVIAALSEKVTQLDPVIRKLLNKVDYGALNVKMDRSKELFELLDDGTITPSGNAPADSLAVELQAGGLSPEHTNYVLSKFNRNGSGFIDFLDFVTYVPLFIEIHEKIVKDPFNVQLFV